MKKNGIKGINAVSILAVGFMMLWANQPMVYGCGCDLPRQQTVKQAVSQAKEEAKAVFLGEVLSIQTQSAHSVTVRFRVEKSWKPGLEEEIEIETGGGSGDCGYRFSLGQKYLVYAYGSKPNEEKNWYGTNICQRTAEQAEAKEDLRYLGKSVESRKKTGKKSA